MPRGSANTPRHWWFSVARSEQDASTVVGSIPSSTGVVCRRVSRSVYHLHGLMGRTSRALGCGRSECNTRH
ncbi:unnamed protein product [Boreogadus saida]